MKQEHRDAVRSMQCPGCHVEVKYYSYSGMGGVYPHFYCDTCSNVYHNYRHRELLLERGESEALLEEFQKELPGCPCGGQFRAGANPKCPSCGTEIPHQASPLERLGDPYAIQLEDAVLCYEERV